MGYGRVICTGFTISGGQSGCHGLNGLHTYPEFAGCQATLHACDVENYVQYVHRCERRGVLLKPCQSTGLQQTTGLQQPSHGARCIKHRRRLMHRDVAVALSTAAVVFCPFNRGSLAALSRLLGRVVLKLSHC